MPQKPGIGYVAGSETDLWRDVSQNFFELAQAFGYNEIAEPTGLDNTTSSMRKCVTFTAFIGDNMP